VYLPVVLIFLAVLITAYKSHDDIWSRWRTVLIAIFFTSLSLPYHFEAGTAGGLIWGLVDPFLSGLAAVTAACVQRATRLDARTLQWTIVACITSSLAIIVKPSGGLVAAAAGFGWVAFGLASLIEQRLRSGWRQRALKLLFGGIVIGAVDAAIVGVALNSGYLSTQNMAFGKRAIAVMRQMDFPTSELWFLLNNGVGYGLLIWVTVVFLAIAFSFNRIFRAVRSTTAIIACVCVVVFGIWLWFVGSGGASFVRYAVPFFMMGLIWLVPVALDAWRMAPLLLRGAVSAVMAATITNLALLLLVPRPALGWQQSSGVGVTADFPKVELSAFKALVFQPSQSPRSIYIMTLDTNDAVLDAFIDQMRLFNPTNSGPWLVRRPVDWQRSATIRTIELETSDVLMVNPQQCMQAPKGRDAANLGEEQGIFTCWADRLTAKDGVTTFLSTPTARILCITNRTKLRASLNSMVSAHNWDSNFVIANRD
jgi:hypothetical protein